MSLTIQNGCFACVCRGWDIRHMAGPVLTLGGHTQAVRRVKCDPYHGNVIASCSYDFTVRWGEFPNSVSIVM